MTHKLTHWNGQKHQQAEDDPKGQSTAAYMLWMCLAEPVGETCL